MGMVIEELEREEARKRQATSTGGSDPRPASEQFPEAESGNVRDKVGE
jgi:hypothetical protein